jgi:LuxR family maltose regulon positive regulatory protein
VEFERGNLTEARRLFNDAIRMAQLWNHWDSLIPASLALSRLEFGSGAPEKAYQVLENLSTRMQADLPSVVPLSQGMLAWFEAASGSPAAASAWSKLIETAPIGHAYFLEHGAWLRAAVYLEIGKYSEALQVLDPAIAESETTGKRGKLIGLLSCRTAALYGLGRIEEARGSLRSALDLASAQGAFQSIADQSRKLRDLLLSELRVQPERTDTAWSKLIRRLLAVSQPASTGQTISSAQEWEEPLSPRELEVLTCMVLGLTNSQIAARLVVTPNTIKKHINAIFSKLQVSTRLQAIEKARTKNYLKK